MIASRMIPAIWFRLIVLIGFVAFMIYQGMWIFGVISGLLIALTVWQLVYAYRERARERDL